MPSLQNVFPFSFLKTIDAEGASLPKAQRKRSLTSRLVRSMKEVRLLSKAGARRDTRLFAKKAAGQANSEKINRQT